MDSVFYISSAVAVLSTIMVITRTNVVHALLYLILSLLSVALVFFVVGAPFVAALEVVIYAGAIMVLFVFAIMMLRLGPTSAKREKEWMTWKSWVLAPVLAGVLLLELLYVLKFGDHVSGKAVVTPQQVGRDLFGPYILGVELASTVLLAGLVGAYHLGRRSKSEEPMTKGNPSPERPPLYGITTEEVWKGRKSSGLSSPPASRRGGEARKATKEQGTA
jgi:NADH-quinone oxidoreductase subunit J